MKLTVWTVDTKEWVVRQEEIDRGEILNALQFTEEDAAWIMLSITAENYGAWSSEQLRVAEDRLKTCLAEYVTATKALLRVRAMVRDRKSKAEMVAENP